MPLAPKPSTLREILRFPQQTPFTTCRTDFGNLSQTNFGATRRPCSLHQSQTHNFWQQQKTPSLKKNSNTYYP